MHLQNMGGGGYLDHTVRITVAEAEIVAIATLGVQAVKIIQFSRRKHPIGQRSRQNIMNCIELLA